MHSFFEFQNEIIFENLESAESRPWVGVSMHVLQ